VIYEWRPHKNYRNYGDALGEIVVEALEVDETILRSSKETAYFPIGSVIDDNHMRPWILRGMTPVYIGCGWYGKEINPKLASRCVFIGARGPDTIAALERAGIEGVNMSGDTAYIAFDYLAVDAPIERTDKLLIPHVLDGRVDIRTDVSDLGLDRVVLPRVISRGDIIKLTRTIAHAEFVLAGAMHVAIAAHAHRTPFAPFSEKFWEGNVSRVKWEDWLESIGVSREKLKFCSDYEEGIAWYKDVFG